MEVGQKATAWTAKWKVLSLIIFTIHASICLTLAIVGGIIFFGFRTAKTAAGADGLRYTGHLLAMLIGIFMVISLIIHWGAKLVRFMFILEFVAFLGQFFAWMLDAYDAAKIKGTNAPYKLAITAAVGGFFISIITLYLALALFFNRDRFAELVDEDDAPAPAA